MDLLGSPDAAPPCGDCFVDDGDLAADRDRAAPGEPLVPIPADEAAPGTARPAKE